MNEVTVSKFNEVYIRIQCDPSIARELSEFFTFEVPGASFMPSVRKRLWDGRIRLFSPGTGKIYYGLHPYVKTFCEKQGYPILEQGVDIYRGVDKELVKKFTKKISKSFKVRPYQLDAIHHIINKDRGLIVSPTGSGKSFIIYALIRYYVDILQDKRILIVVPTTSLVEQMYSDFAEYGWFPDVHCHRLYSGEDKNSSKEVTISTWQSIYKMPKNYFNQFGATIVDECHLAKAKSLTGIMTKLHDCQYRIGTTGTLDGIEVHQLVLEGLFGKCEQVTTTQQLIKDKHLSQLHIRCIILEHPKNKRRKMDYQEEISFLSEDDARDKFIANLILHEEGNTLVLCRLIKQVEKLFEMVNVKGRKVFLVYGGTDVKDREEVRRIVEGEDNAIIVASYGVFSTGINIKRLHNIVFASPYKSQIKVLQSIGRGLRVSEDKKHLSVFDIADDLCYNNRQNFSLKHFEERVKIYNEQEFDYDIIPVKLK